MLRIYLDRITNAISHTCVQYGPDGEYREEFVPEDYLNDFEFQYGISPSTIN